jgi:hypothetical protein
MKIVIVVSSRNMQYGAGMNRVIYNAYSELIREFDEVIIVSAKNSKELFLGVIKLLKSNPCSFDFIIFNSLSSIRKSHNKFWYLFWLLASVFKIRKVMYWHEMPNYLKKFKDNKENKRDMILINRFLLNKKIKHLSVSSESAKSSYFLNATTESTVVYNTIISKPKFSLLYSTFTVQLLEVFSTLKVQIFGQMLLYQFAMLTKTSNLFGVVEH